jgi:hypothetical protein
MEMTEALSQADCRCQFHLRSGSANLLGKYHCADAVATPPSSAGNSMRNLSISSIASRVRLSRNKVVAV